MGIVSSPNTLINVELATIRSNWRQIVHTGRYCVISSTLIALIQLKRQSNCSGIKSVAFRKSLIGSPNCRSRHYFTLIWNRPETIKRFLKLFPYSTPTWPLNHPKKITKSRNATNVNSIIILKIIAKIRTNVSNVPAPTPPPFAINPKTHPQSVATVLWTTRRIGRAVYIIKI